VVPRAGLLRGSEQFLQKGFSQYDEQIVISPMTTPSKPVLRHSLMPLGGCGVTYRLRNCYIDNMTLRSRLFGSWHRKEQQESPLIGVQFPDLDRGLSSVLVDAALVAKGEAQNQTKCARNVYGHMTWSCALTLSLNGTKCNYRPMHVMKRGQLKCKPSRLNSITWLVLTLDTQLSRDGVRELSKVRKRFVFMYITQC
jgi:hypothetical protein